MTANPQESWQQLSAYLRTHWTEIVRKGSFDLTKVFPRDTAKHAVAVQLFFVKLLGDKLRAERIDVDLDSWTAALRAGEPHADVTLLVASSTPGPGKFLSYNSDVSTLRQGDEVLSALWVHLVHPIAIKICYVKSGAPVREPVGFPWHPTRQRKVVKLSPFKGDAQPEVARRDLRI